MYKITNIKCRLTGLVCDIEKDCSECDVCRHLSGRDVTVTRTEAYGKTIVDKQTKTCESYDTTETTRRY